MQQSIPLDVDVGHLQAELLEFCRDMADVFRLPEQLTEEVPRLRARACAYQQRPTTTELKFMLVCNVLLDLALHGRTVHVENRRIRLCAPDEKEECPTARKDRIRQRHLIERDAQLEEPSVREFIKGMERRRLTSKGWHSIYSVMRDGDELAASLRRAATYADMEERARELVAAIDPYLQFVTPDAICPETGLRLNDIWRYFRHTWVNMYRSVPGRSLMILVRDRARPYHPVIGIAALASSVVQQSIRDKWIGWDSDIAVSSLVRNPSRKVINCLLDQLQHFLKDIYIADLIRDNLLTAKEIRNPSEAVIRALRKEAERAIQLHRKNPEAAEHKRGKRRSNKDWEALAESNLFRSKRCKHLAALLDVQRVLRRKNVKSLSGKALKVALQEPGICHALRRIIRFGKAQRVGISMMDIMVCGAVAPYNVILGGKLVCLLLFSPETVQAYASRYENQVSLIASSMKGRRVLRNPKLVLLCTTSLYGNGSSQYNRIKLSADLVGGTADDVLQYEELGTSEGFGSFQFSKESVRLADALLGRSKHGRKVNSIFGEGVNPLMRKMREALTAVGLPSESLLKHGNKRIVYGIPLARNFRSILLGIEDRPRYMVPQRSPRKGTALLGQYWIKRWLSKRIEDPTILERVAVHSLAYPVSHGAQVQLPTEEAPELVRLMAAAASE